MRKTSGQVLLFFFLILMSCVFAQATDTPDSAAPKESCVSELNSAKSASHQTVNCVGQSSGHRFEFDFLSNELNVDIGQASMEVLKEPIFINAETSEFIVFSSERSVDITDPSKTSKLKRYGLISKVGAGLGRIQTVDYVKSLNRVLSTTVEDMSCDTGEK